MCRSTSRRSGRHHGRQKPNRLKGRGNGTRVTPRSERRRDMNIHLFRVKVFPSDQKSFFNSEFNASLVLLDAITKTPSVERKKGHTWHIGNVENLDQFGVYFALGRTTVSTTSLYDEDTHNFVEIDSEEAPFTHVFCDTSFEV